jgi:SNF2 family DNA or RNA helicase
VGSVTARVDPAYPDKITIESGFEHREAVNTMLAVRYDSKSRLWRAPLSWTACTTLRAIFGDDLIVDRTLIDWSLEEYNTRVVPALGLRDSITLEDGRSELNEATLVTNVLGDELGLFPHQSVGAAFMATTERCLIADETGTGKSAQAIAALRSLHRMGRDVFPALIVAPASVKIPWSREIEQWYPDLTVTVVEGSAVKRRKQLETPAHIYIMNWEQLAGHSRLMSYGGKALARCSECGAFDTEIDPKKCEVHERELNRIDFQTVIADELHRATSPSKQTRALWAVGDKAKYRFGMTGTPIQDNLDDLWFVLRFISPQDFPAKSRFLDRYADVGYNRWGAIEIQGLKAEHEEEFHKVIDPFMRRMLKKVVLDFLPPIVTETRFVELSGAQAKAYRDLKKHQVTEIDGKALAARDPLMKAMRLLQFASSYGEVLEVPVDKSKFSNFDLDGTDPFADEDDDFKTELRLAMPSNKITAFLEDVKSGDYGDSSLVVFASSRQLLEMLSQEMTKKDIAHGMITGGQNADDRQYAIDAFQNGELKYILVSIAAGGTGLTLTKADTMVFLQRPWSSTQFVQAQARAHRIGSQIHESVTIVHYITRGTVEEWQMEALDGKFGRIETILRDQALIQKYVFDESD